MKKKVLGIAAAAMLVLGTSGAWAVPTINIYDTFESAPIVTTSGFTTPLGWPWGGDNPRVTTALEYARVIGILTSGFISVGFYGIKILEPAFEGGGLSAFAVLAVEEPIDVLDWQQITLTFLSEGAVDFAAALDIFDLGVSMGVTTELPSIVENGSLQNLFYSMGLEVNAQFDVIPIPASVVLFGTGLLGLVPVWRFRRQA